MSQDIRSTWLRKETVSIIENSSWKSELGEIVSTTTFDDYFRSKSSNFSIEACKQIRESLHTCGIVYNSESYIVSDLQWLADALRSLISVKHNNQIDGTLSQQEIDSRLSNYSEKTRKMLMDFLSNELKICIQHPKKVESYIFPCLIQTGRPQDIDNRWKRIRMDTVGRFYKVPFLPQGIFNTIFVKLCKCISPAVKFWKNGLLLGWKNDNYLLAELISNHESHSTFTTCTIQLLVTGIFHNSILIACSGSESTHLLLKSHLIVMEFVHHLEPVEIVVHCTPSNQEKLFSRLLDECILSWKRGEVIQIGESIVETNVILPGSEFFAPPK